MLKLKIILKNRFMLPDVNENCKSIIFKAVLTQGQTIRLKKCA
jgi:hypothetical protein